MKFNWRTPFPIKKLNLTAPRRYERRELDDGGPPGDPRRLRLVPEGEGEHDGPGELRGRVQVGPVLVLEQDRVDGAELELAPAHHGGALAARDVLGLRKLEPDME